MSTITLPNIRVSSDLQVRVRLKDGGVAIDWSTLSNIRACIYSDAQRALAGRCAFSIDEEDNTLLVCTYAANKPQYLGVNRIVISAKYMGETKTYDKPAFSFVRWTADQEGEEITIDDPDVDVEIDVEDISSSILQEAVDAANTAAERANDAAEAAEHMVDIHTGPQGKSAYEVAVDEGYVGTEEQWLASLKGDTGETPDITIGTVTTVAPGTPAAATMTGTPEDPVLNLTIPQGAVGATPAFTVGTVTTGAPGSSVIVTISGTAEAPVLNVTIPQGMQGNTGSSVDYPYELVNNRTTDDATKGLSAAEGKRLGDDISQLEHEQYGYYQLIWDNLGAAAFWDEKPDIDFSGNSVLVSLTLDQCTSSNNAFITKLGDPYNAIISPYPSCIFREVKCWMSGVQVPVTNGVISIQEVTGPITISASAYGLDEIAYEELTYREIFEENNILGISPGFEDGSYAPLVQSTSPYAPTITTEDVDSGEYSLKCFGNDNHNVRIDGYSTRYSLYLACRVKVVSYTAGGIGILSSILAGCNAVTDGWVTKTALKETSQSTANSVIVGSVQNANLNGYVDTPVVVQPSVFTTPPSIAKFTELYEVYVQMKKNA